jgi:hypothetical protein
MNDKCIKGDGGETRANPEQTLPHQAKTGRYPKSYRQNTNLLSNLWSLICLPAERRMPWSVSMKLTMLSGFSRRFEQAQMTK